MNDTLLNAYSGIKTHQFGIDSLSNNIANINTLGYRSNEPEFKSLFSSHLDALNAKSVMANDRNYGVTGAGNALLSKDGEYMPSEGDFHMAYQGKGWFVIGPNKNGTLTINKDGYEKKQDNFLTRSGNFVRDADGYLVTPEGYYVYGVDLHKIKDGTLNATPRDEDIEKLHSNTLSPLKIPQDLTYQPVLSTKVDISVNLNPKDHVKGAQEFFLDDKGAIIEKRFLNQDINALANDDNEPLDAITHRKLNISVQKDGKKEDFTFTYGDSEKGENQFKTLGDLKKLLKEKTGLDLNLIKSEDDVKKPPLLLEIANPSDNPVIFSLSGGIADKLGLSANEMELKKGIARDSVAIRIPYYSTSADIYDEAGNKYLLQSEYFMTNSNDPASSPTSTRKNQTWQVKSYIVDSREKDPINEPIWEIIGFDSETHKMKATPITLDFKGNKLTYSLDKSESHVSSDLSYQESKLLEVSQDGKPKGIFRDMRIEENGIISLSFSNGAVEPVARIGILAFTNDQGLRKVGGNVYEMEEGTINGQNRPLSGNPILGWDEEGKLKFGKIRHKYLETSNVNAGNALTNLILMQRGYSMNAKAFSTGDDMIKEAISLKK
ncbi:flagellar hook protein FlgE [Helicobacter cetorum]|uniref:Flagellar hook protein FlgE n=1 Tax=Helicobacter cetorum (strain ATCC BAA-540 / CCUG 52418 / MIT 99-5656) TaxID=1163745 RepID=I0ETQ9_HELCM|nr:flagellar hook protein FlgE [Helicobacter cetorum]AFI06328.1 flagellar hook protein FlgE [Helicobacter cetorum MIT 99-5656]